MYIIMESKISYTKRDEDLFRREKPYISLVPFVSSGARFTNTETEEHTMTITNVRGREGEFSLDCNGFAYVTFSSPHLPPDTVNGPEDLFVQDMAELLKSHLGAKSVHVYDGNTRKVGNSNFLQASTYAHIDHTSSDCQWRLEQWMAENNETELPRRWQFINIWVPMNGPVLDAPLAVCDYQSTEPKDLIAVDSVFPHRVMEVWNIHHNPKHRWYYMDHQNIDEVLIFKTGDSDEASSRYCPHSSLPPKTTSGTIVRESIELRSIVTY
ncbi:hypothetical protein F5Y10DRAFT_211571 [Nemania abortiva]|nr:hypothetical protein F5Y10DRAFT_211571 [Nemania abortiva]